MGITIRLMASTDIEIISSAFKALGSHRKTPALYERYLDEQKKGERVVLVAHLDGDFAGYGTIQWQ